MIINVRLGVDSIEPNWIPIIKKYMGMRQFVGVIGGQPRKALYFVGSTQSERRPEEEQLVYIDPHNVYNYYSHDT